MYKYLASRPASDNDQKNYSTLAINNMIEASAFLREENGPTYFFYGILLWLSNNPTKTLKDLQLLFIKENLSFRMVADVQDFRPQPSKNYSFTYPYCKKEHALIICSPNTGTCEFHYNKMLKIQGLNHVSNLEALQSCGMTFMEPSIGNMNTRIQNFISTPEATGKL